MRISDWSSDVCSSDLALVASPFKSAYVAAKHGIAGLTKTVALEVAEQGITVNAIFPGYVRTPLVEKQIPDTAKARGITAQQVITDVMLHDRSEERRVGNACVSMCSSQLQLQQSTKNNQISVKKTQNL